ncbi:hypothetical protein [Lysinibacillus sp. 54212]|uniref:hypothetical protein n=1 Tax=Lysinibacillus sp. 54212 TaxID=3119829 RepID=UPI002FC97788
MARYILLAKLRSGQHYLLTFNRDDILDCLNQFPTDRGLEVLVEWPLENKKELNFFLEMLTKNVCYYYLKDLVTEERKFVNVDPSY